MATVRTLTWHKATKRWKKIYKGRTLYLGYGKSKSDDESYRAALEQFAIKRAEIDAELEQTKPHADDYKRAIELRQAMVKWLLLERDNREQYDRQANADSIAEENEQVMKYMGREEYQSLPDLPEDGFLPYAAEYDLLVKELDRLNKDFARVNPLPLDTPGRLPVNPLTYRSRNERDVWLKRLEILRRHEEWTGTTDYEKSIGANIDRFLALKKAAAQAGQSKAGSYATLKARLEIFRSFIGEQSVEAFNSRSLAAFHGELIQRLEQGKMKPATAAGILTATKSFVRWLWRNEIIDNLPRNIGDLQIGTGIADIETFTAAELKTLLDNSSERTQLYLLLMANCGMTQQDISDLAPGEVDWEEGTITRRRSKTSHQRTAPVVRYKLWDRTLALLKRHGNRTGRRVLTNRKGGELRDRGFRQGEKRIENRNNDNIAVAYQRVCRKLKIRRPKPLKLLRKTGASLLEQHETHGRYVQYYLGHAPGSVAERHYVRPSDVQFFQALLWLGQQLGTA